MIDHQAKLQGFEPDTKVTIDSRHWDALKRTVWRMQTSWRFVERAASEILARCRHADGCPGTLDTTAPCLRECPDRETRMDALVICSNASGFIVNAVGQLPATSYTPPTREHYDLIVAAAVTAEEELDALKLKNESSHAEPPDTEYPPALPETTTETP
jgi:hypothetical protein